MSGYYAEFGALHREARVYDELERHAEEVRDELRAAFDRDRNTLGDDAYGEGLLAIAAAAEAPEPAGAALPSGGPGTARGVGDKRRIGRLATGAPADVVVIDPERSWVYDPYKGYSKSRNSPWAGQTLQGRAVATIVAGRLVYDVDRGVLAP